MGIEGDLKPRNVWGNEGSKGNFSPESFADGDAGEMDYLIKSDGAANDPSLRDVAPSSFTRNAIETDSAVVEQLLGGTELELENAVQLKTNTSVYNDPSAPTGAQVIAAKEIYNSDRDRNLDRIIVPRDQGAPMKDGGEIPGDINKVSPVINDVDSWKKPAPVREQKPERPSLLKRLFG